MTRKILIGISIFMGVSISHSIAQDYRNMGNKSPDESAQMVTKRMTKRLDLTEDQKNDVQRVYADFFSKQKDLEKEYPELDQAKKEMRALKESERNAVKSILTTEQLTQLRELMDSRSASRENRPKTPEEKVAKLKEELKLNTKQESELLVLFQNGEKKRSEIKSNYPELKEARKAMKTLKKDLFAELKKILNESQFEQLKSMKKGGNRRAH